MPTWDEIIKAEQSKPYYSKLMVKVDNAYATEQTFPPREKMLAAFDITPYDKVKCVILGQDPYHDDGQAMGLCFSVPDDIDVPRSLRNMYKELAAEMPYDIPNHGNLTKWAEEGVLLLNTTLTVKAHNAASHSKWGWGTFTDAIIKALNEKEEPVVFMLWGNHARSKKEFITNPNHLVLEAAHPSPLSASRGFFGCNHFVLCNEYLESKNIPPIDWQV